MNRIKLLESIYKLTDMLASDALENEETFAKRELIVALNNLTFAVLQTLRLEIEDKPF